MKSNTVAWHSRSKTACVCLMHEYKAQIRSKKKKKNPEVKPVISCLSNTQLIWTTMQADKSFLHHAVYSSTDAFSLKKGVTMGDSRRQVQTRSWEMPDDVLVVLCDISMIRNTFYKCAHTGLNYHINKLQLLRDPLKKGNALPVTTMTSSDLNADTYWMNCRPFWISCQRILLSWHGPDMFARFSIHSSVSTWNHDMTLY